MNKRKMYIPTNVQYIDKRYEKDDMRNVNYLSLIQDTPLECYINYDIREYYANIKHYIEDFPICFYNMYKIISEQIPENIADDSLKYLVR